MPLLNYSFGHVEQRELSADGKLKHSNFERTDLDVILAACAMALLRKSPGRWPASDILRDLRATYLIDSILSMNE
jgi:hypothetical protein